MLLRIEFVRTKQWFVDDMLCCMGATWLRACMGTWERLEVILQLYKYTRSLLRVPASFTRKVFLG